MEPRFLTESSDSGMLRLCAPSVFAVAKAGSPAQHLLVLALLVPVAGYTAKQISGTPKGMKQAVARAFPAKRGGYREPVSADCKKFPTTGSVAPGIWFKRAQRGAAWKKRLQTGASACFVVGSRVVVSGRAQGDSRRLPREAVLPRRSGPS